jgi:hypothetical protein
MQESDNLAAHAERIRASEFLGSSTRLARLFDFLIDCSSRGKVPKEVEIAIDVFQRSAAFDPGQDAAVRVYIHKLRRRLEDFYAGPGAREQNRLVLARGEYRVLLEPADRTVPRPEQTGPPSRVRRRYLSRWMELTLACSLIFNTVVLLAHWRGTHRDDSLQRVLDSPVWAPIVKDRLPVTVVVGDYYIFGETDEAQEVTRLVREFNINSSLQLQEYAQSHPDNEHYRDLDLTYLPSSVAAALARVMPILSAHDRAVRVVLMSQLTPDTLTRSDIVYIGFLSGLGMLHEIAFAGSAFAVGDTYDEIVHRKSGRRYISQGASFWHGGETYKDYGYFATFAGPKGNRVVIISGTRDVALANTAELAAKPQSLTQLSRQATDKSDFEALYEVYGVDRASLDSRLLITSALDSRAKWRN